MQAVSALSTHPLAATALGEAAGQVLEALGGAHPTLVLVTVTPPHLGTLEDVGAAIRALLAPDVVIGAVAPAVLGGGRHVVGPALALFALTGVPVSPLTLAAGPGGGLDRHGDLDGAAAALVLGDPFSCPAEALLGALGDLPAGGGLVGAGRGPGGSRLLLDGAVHTTGAVGALLGRPAEVVASQGWIPTGEAWVVTRSGPAVVLALGGRPAAVRQAQALGEGVQAGALGLLLDDRAEEPDRAQLLAVPVLGTVGGGGLRVARTISVGRVVRFLRTGRAEVEADLVAALAPFAPRPSGALLFPAEGRNGDAALVSDLLGCPVAGAGVGAPLAPVAGRPGLHGPGATALVVFP